VRYRSTWATGTVAGAGAGGVWGGSTHRRRDVRPAPHRHGRGSDVQVTQSCPHRDRRQPRHAAARLADPAERAHRAVHRRANGGRDGGGADRWPTFAAAVADGGAFSPRSMRIPLRLPGRPSGPLNLFHGRSGSHSARDLVLGQALADVATIGILSAFGPSTVDFSSEGLGTPSPSLRSIVRVAAGGGLPGSPPSATSDFSSDQPTAPSSRSSSDEPTVPASRPGDSDGVDETGAVTPDAHVRRQRMSPESHVQRGCKRSAAWSESRGKACGTAQIHIEKIN